MYVVGHICKVISLKSKVGQAKIFMKTCVEGIASKFSFLAEKKIVMVSETGSLIMYVCTYIKSQRPLQCHRIAEVGRDLSRSCSPMPLPLTRSARAGCPVSCAFGF